DPLVGDDPDGVAVDVREAGDDSGAVLGLELVEPAAVGDAGDDLARVVRGLAVRRDGAVEGLLVYGGGLGLAAFPWTRRLRGKGSDDAADDPQGVIVVRREVVDDTGGLGVQLAAAELLRGHLLPG